MTNNPRIQILDALRGFALLGIALANFPEFSLYSFLPESVAAAMPSADADGVTRWLQLLLIDGKFYTIFSVLFGIGFSIIIGNARKRGADGMRIFYRRMLMLALFGFLHLMLLWSGDILLLYALMGMILPAFYSRSNKTLLIWASVLLILPVLCDILIAVTGIDPSKVPYDLWWYWAGRFGICEENFHTWLRDADSYVGMSQFLVQGAFERMWEFVVSHRYFKVLGLFVLGLYIGKNGIHANIETQKPLLKKVCKVAICVALPLSGMYAWSATCDYPLGKIVHSIIYVFSVYPLGVGYMAALSILYLYTRDSALWKSLAFPGKMSLTTYISQSVMGVVLFYGVGFGLGCSLGLWQTELVAVGVYLLLMAFAWLWLRKFDRGPLEWLWRRVVYGK